MVVITQGLTLSQALSGVGGLEFMGGII